MRNQYKVLSEKYDQVLEADQKPTLRVHPDGAKEWFQNGMFHRLDGPAVEYSDGSKGWYQNGMRHRLDGPAIEYPNGTKEWYQNDKRHRLDGPAIEFYHGDKEWYVDGIEYNEKEFDLKKRTRELLKKASDETGIEMDI